MKQIILSLCVLLIGLAVVASAPAEEPAFVVSSPEPFVLDLRPDRLPATATVIDVKHPLRLTAARSHAVAGVLSLRASRALPALPMRVEPIRCGEAVLPGEGVTVAVIRTVRRTKPQGLTAADRYPADAGRGIHFPEILVRDEVAFEAALASGELPLPDEDDEEPARIAATAAGAVKHLLVTIDVPGWVPPGDFSGAVLIGETEVPLRLTVLPFRLEATTGVWLGVGNDLAQPGGPWFEESLALLSRIGMNFVRIPELTSLLEPAATLLTLEENGFKSVLQEKPPRRPAHLKRIPPEFDLFFRGLDEPQPPPKGPEDDWRRMKEHIRLSERLHGMGVRVASRLPFPLAAELSVKGSPVYKRVGSAAHEPLDWAGYGLEFLRVGRQGDDTDLLRYVAKLQKEFWRADWSDEPPSLRGKNPWRETYWWRAGQVRYPFFARLLFGFHLFASRLDGVEAMSLFRTYGLDPHADGPEPVITLAHPGETTLYSTYNLEAIREGVVDLRYAQQARRAIGRLLASDDPVVKGQGKRLRREMKKLLDPWSSLFAKGKRIDLSMRDPERRLRETREALSDLILSAE